MDCPIELEKYGQELIRSIKLTDELWEELIRFNIIKDYQSRLHIESIFPDTKDRLKEILKKVQENGSLGYRELRKALFCNNQEIIVEKYLPRPESTGEVHDVKERLARWYLSQYKKMLLWDLTTPCPVDFDVLYTDILLKKIDRTAAEREKCAEQNYTELLLDELKRILIYGSSGIGKSTLCQRICLDWSAVVTDGRPRHLKEEQIQVFRNIDYLFYINLREMGENDTLHDILKKQLVEKIGCEIFQIFNSEHDNLVLMADGLDEICNGESQILDVMHGTVFPQVKCLVTCRNTESVRSEKFDAIFQHTGLSRSKVRNFVHVYFKLKYPEAKDSDLASLKEAIVLQRITTTPELLDLAINPSSLQSICFNILNNTSSTEQIMPDIYITYSHILIRQYKAKHPHDKLKEKQTLLTISKLAYAEMLQCHIQPEFSMQVSSEICGENYLDKFCKMGFLKPILYSDTIGYNDTNKMEEFEFTNSEQKDTLAAYAICKSYTKADILPEKLANYVSCSTSLVGLPLLVSLIMHCINRDFVTNYCDTLDLTNRIGSPERTLLLLALLIQNPNIRFSLPENIHVNLEKHNTQKERKSSVRTEIYLNEYLDLDGSAVKTIVFDLQRLCKIDFTRKSRLRDTMLNILKYIRYLVCDANTKLGKIVFSGTPFEIFAGLFNESSAIISRQPSQVEFIQVKCETTYHKTRKIMHLMEALSCCSPVDLYISRCVSSNITVDIIEEFITEEVTASKRDKLSFILPEPQIRKLLIHKQFIQFAKPSPWKLSISIDNCGILIDETILKSFSQLSKNVDLDISGNKLISQLLCLELLGLSNRLKSLTMRNCKIKIDHDIIECLLQLPDTAKVDVSCNSLTQTRHLCEILRYLPRQENLDFSLCSVSVITACMAFIRTLRYLHILIFRDNKVSPQLVSTLSDSLKHTTEINEFTMNNCGVSSAHAEGLLESLFKLGSKLKVLDLGNNNLSVMEPTCFAQVEKLSELRSLIMCNCHLQKEAGNILVSTFIKHCRKLEEINISNNNLSGMKAAYFDSVPLPNRLVKLYFSQCFVEEHTIIAIVNNITLHCENISILYLNGNCLSGLQPSHCESIEHLPDLLELNVANGSMTRQSSSALLYALSQHCPRIELICLGGNDLSGANFNFLTSHRFPYLRSLWLSTCSINKHFFAELVKNVLENSMRVRELFFNGNDLSQFPARIFRISQFKDLERVSFGSCNLEAETCISLLQNILKYCRKIRELYLNDNCMRKCKSNDIELEFPLECLQVLNLSNCSIIGKLSEALVQYVAQFCHAALYSLNLNNNNLSGVDTNSFEYWHVLVKLHELFLRGCSISLEGSEVLCTVLFKHCRELRKLDLSWNDLSKVAYDNIVLLQHLEELLLKGCLINDKGFSVLINGLSRYCVYLRILSVSQNDLSKSDHFVFQDFGNLKYLEQLFVSNCQLTMDSIHSLLITVSTYNKELATLDISGNNMSEVRSDALQSLPCKLRKLYVNNCSITEQTCRELLHSIQQKYKTLVELDIRNNALSQTEV